MAEDEWFVILKKKYQLSDDDVEEYIESFELINGGNPISAKNLASLINSELRDTNISERHCLNKIVEINENINGMPKGDIDLKTYLQYIIPICQKYVIMRIGIKELFDTIDTDFDNLITCEQFISVLYKLNKKFTTEQILQYKKQLKKLCSQIDVNGNGLISYDEFKIFFVKNNFLIQD
jgi:Ca2+-binding EF-hand superfamily protein